MVTKKRQKVNVGDVFAIPLLDGTSGLGQVIEEWMPQIICIAVFDGIIKDTDHLDLSSVGSAIALPSVAAAEIKKGYWKTVGHLPLQIDATAAPHKIFEHNRYIGAVWSAGAVIEDFLNAFHGLASWEPYPGKPGRLRELLLPPAS